MSLSQLHRITTMANRDVRQSKRVKRVPDRLGHSATSNDIEAAMFENSVEVSTEVSVFQLDFLESLNQL